MRYYESAQLPASLQTNFTDSKTPFCSTGSVHVTGLGKGSKRMAMTMAVVVMNG